MKHAPNLPDNLHDIQAVIKSGFGWLPRSRFQLLTIKENQEGAAKLWIKSLIVGECITSVEKLIKDRESKVFVKKASAIAFSFEGLLRLGIKPDEEFPFPTAFRSGMGSALREKLLRDESRAEWLWSDIKPASSKKNCTHILLAQWCCCSNELANLIGNDSTKTFEIKTVDGCADFFKADKLYEPFGFRDGISQPTIFGMPVDGDDLGSKGKQLDYARDKVIAAGEFILGYRNEYNELNYCPDVRGWTGRPASSKQSTPKFSLNGSYMAVRQIEQHVDSFEKWNRQTNLGETLPPGVSASEKLIGRRKNGSPLTPGGNLVCPFSDDEADDFRFRVSDADGFYCPKGAHIRRVNPRDTLGVDVRDGIYASKLHRLLRRGRPYREKPEFGAISQGTFFIAFNADLERQFEFVYQRWLKNPRFVDLEDQDDPVTGRNSENRSFTIPALPFGKKVSLADFTRTVGGGYFFLPGLAALEFIANCKA